eukprot:TRINITY_DN4839_c1_g2_i1.p1 TRINITY_DN4839_c1_g2~~TRINITY_DN4839_c1_g2_i1.p1  ORF type:complete len:2819 (+),score=723.41 TRINITY_DN4839_c1_g2_i1:209-8665(+)
MPRRLRTGALLLSWLLLSFYLEGAEGGGTATATFTVTLPTATTTSTVTATISTTRSATASATRTTTATRSVSATATQTMTATRSASASSTLSLTFSRTYSMTRSTSVSRTMTRTASTTATATATRTFTQTRSYSTSQSRTASLTTTFSASTTKTMSQSSTATITATGTVSPTNEITATLTMPTQTSTATATTTLPTATATVSMTVSRSASRTQSMTGSATSTVTQTMPTATQTLSGTVTMPTVSSTMTATATNTATMTRGATMTLTMPTATQTATGTFTMPTASTTQSASLSLPTATQSLTGSMTMPSVTPTATMSITLPSPTMSMTGSMTMPSVTPTATMSITLPSPTMSMTASFSIPSKSPTMTMSITLPSATSTRTVSFTLPSFTATSEITATLPTATATRTVTMTVPSATASTTVSISMPSATVSRTVTVSLPTMTRTASATFSMPTATATMTMSGTATVTATATMTASMSLPSYTRSVTATVTLPSGSSTVTSTLTLPTATLTLQATMTLPTATATATRTMTLPTMTVSKTATITVPSSSATLSSTISLPSMTVTATKTMTIPTTSWTSTLSMTLPSYTRTSTMTVSIPSMTRTATMSYTVPSMSATTTSTVTLPSASRTSTATYTVPSATVTKTASMSLPTLTRTGTFTSTLTATVTMPTMTASRTATWTVPTTSVTRTTTMSVPTATVSTTSTFTMPTGAVTASRTFTMPTVSVTTSRTFTMPSMSQSLTFTLSRTSSVTVSVPSVSVTSTYTLPTSTPSREETKTRTLPTATLTEGPFCTDAQYNTWLGTYDFAGTGITQPTLATAQLDGCRFVLLTGTCGLTCAAGFSSNQAPTLSCSQATGSAQWTVSHTCSESICAAITFQSGWEATATDGCTNGIQLRSTADPTCSVQCANGFGTGTATFTCGNNGVLTTDPAGFSCAETRCAAYTFPAGVEGGATDPCTSGIRLSPTTDPTCTLRCSTGYSGSAATLTCPADAIDGAAAIGGASCARTCQLMTCGTGFVIKTNPAPGTISCPNSVCSDALCCDAAACPANAATDGVCTCNTGFTGTPQWQNNAWTHTCVQATCPANAAGAGCQCNTGFTGTPQWDGTQWTHTCSASAACPANSGGTGCICNTGFLGTPNFNTATGTWTHTCTAAPCPAGASPPGTCACTNGAATTPVWSGTQWTHNCPNDAPCPALASPVGVCNCPVGYVGPPTFDGTRWTHTCTAATCPADSSGAGVCACNAGFSGTPAWDSAGARWSHQCVATFRECTCEEACDISNQYRCVNTVGTFSRVCMDSVTACADFGGVLCRGYNVAPPLPQQCLAATVSGVVVAVATPTVVTNGRIPQLEAAIGGAVGLPAGQISVAEVPAAVAGDAGDGATLFAVSCTGTNCPSEPTLRARLSEDAAKGTGGTASANGFPIVAVEPPGTSHSVSTVSTGGVQSLSPSSTTITSGDSVAFNVAGGIEQVSGPGCLTAAGADGSCPGGITGTNEQVLRSPGTYVFRGINNPGLTTAVTVSSTPPPTPDRTVGYTSTGTGTGTTRQFSTTTVTAVPGESVAFTIPGGVEQVTGPGCTSTAGSTGACPGGFDGTTQATLNTAGTYTVRSKVDPTQTVTVNVAPAPTYSADHTVGNSVSGGTTGFSVASVSTGAGETVAWTIPGAVEQVSGPGCTGLAGASGGACPGGFDGVSSYNFPTPGTYTVRSKTDPTKTMTVAVGGASPANVKTLGFTETTTGAGTTRSFSTPAVTTAPGDTVSFTLPGGVEQVSGPGCSSAAGTSGACPGGFSGGQSTLSAPGTYTVRSATDPTQTATISVVAPPSPDVAVGYTTTTGGTTGFSEPAINVAPGDSLSFSIPGGVEQISGPGCTSTTANAACPGGFDSTSTAAPTLTAKGTYTVRSKTDPTQTMTITVADPVAPPLPEHTVGVTERVTPTGAVSRSFSASALNVVPGATVAWSMPGGVEQISGPGCVSGAGATGPCAGGFDSSARQLLSTPGSYTVRSKSDPTQTMTVTVSATPNPTNRYTVGFRETAQSTGGTTTGFSEQAISTVAGDTVSWTLPGGVEQVAGPGCTASAPAGGGACPGGFDNVNQQAIGTTGTYTVRSKTDPTQTMLITVQSDRNAPASVTVTPVTGAATEHAVGTTGSGSAQQFSPGTVAAALGDAVTWSMSGGVEQVSGPGCQGTAPTTGPCPGGFDAVTRRVLSTSGQYVVRSKVNPAVTMTVAVSERDPQAAIAAACPANSAGAGVCTCNQGYGGTPWFGGATAGWGHTCTRNTCEAPTSATANANYESCAGLTTNEQCTPDCAGGYTRSAGTSFTLQCNADGTYVDSSGVQCTAVPGAARDLIRTLRVRFMTAATFQAQALAWVRRLLDAVTSATPSGRAPVSRLIARYFCNIPVARWTAGITAADRSSSRCLAIGAQATRSVMRRAAELQSCTSTTCVSLVEISSETAQTDPQLDATISSALTPQVRTDLYVEQIVTTPTPPPTPSPQTPIPVSTSDDDDQTVWIPLLVVACVLFCCLLLLIFWFMRRGKKDKEREKHRDISYPQPSPEGYAAREKSAAYMPHDRSRTPDGGPRGAPPGSLGGAYQPAFPTPSPPQQSAAGFLPPHQYMPSDPVEVLYDGDWVGANIHELQPDGTYVVDWGDGQETRGVSEDELRPRAARQYREGDWVDVKYDDEWVEARVTAALGDDRYNVNWGDGTVTEDVAEVLLRPGAKGSPARQFPLEPVHNPLGGLFRHDMSEPSAGEHPPVRLHPEAGRDLGWVIDPASMRLLSVDPGSPAAVLDSYVGMQVASVNGFGVHSLADLDICKREPTTVAFRAFGRSPASPAG